MSPIILTGKHIISIKLLDYRDRWKELEISENPFALVVMAHLKMLETRDDYEKRLHWKIELTQMLYARGYTEQKVHAWYPHPLAPAC